MNSKQAHEVLLQFIMRPSNRVRVLEAVTLVNALNVIQELVNTSERPLESKAEVLEAIQSRNGPLPI